MLVLVFLFAFAAAHSNCDPESAVRYYVELSNGYFNDPEAAGAHAALDYMDKFFQHQSWNGQRINRDLFKAIGTVANFQFHLKDIATENKDTVIVVWNESFVFADHTRISSVEATVARFDMQSCVPLTWHQVLDEKTEKAVQKKVEELLKSGAKLSRPNPPCDLSDQVKHFVTLLEQLFGDSLSKRAGDELNRLLKHTTWGQLDFNEFAKRYHGTYKLKHLAVNDEKNVALAVLGQRLKFQDGVSFEYDEVLTFTYDLPSCTLIAMDEVSDNTLEAAFHAKIKSNVPDFARPLKKSEL